jgi:hypothetical protein
VADPLPFVTAPLLVVTHPLLLVTDPLAVDYAKCRAANRWPLLPSLSDCR